MHTGTHLAITRHTHITHPIRINVQQTCQNLGFILCAITVLQHFKLLYVYDIFTAKHFG